MTSPLCRRVLEHEWKLYVERLKKTTDELDCVIATAEAVFQKYNYVRPKSRFSFPFFIGMPKFRCESKKARDSS